MNILLFGGNSQRNKEWIHEVGEVLTPDFRVCVVHDYDHWDGRGEFIDFELELSRLDAEVKNLGRYIVFAKSAGSLLTLMAIKQGILAPEKCIFAGLPIKLAEEDDIPLAELLRDNSVPALIMQNTDDPIASFVRLNGYLAEAGVNSYRTVELPGDTHGYDDLTKIRSLIQEFIKAA